MNDVKEICELALDVAAPPLRDGGTALALARRATRRRDRLVTTAAGLTVVAITTAVFATRLTATVDSEPTNPATLASQATATGIAPAVPTWQQAQAHGQQIADILIGAVPVGYTAAAEYQFPQGPTATWLREPPSTSYSSLTSIVVSAGRHEGLLQSYIIRDDVPAPAGDLCSRGIAARFDSFLGVSGHCDVISVNGVPIRVTTRHDTQRGSVVIAIRMLDGGYLAVQSSQGRPTYATDRDLPPDAAHTPGRVNHTPPTLTAAVFTNAQLATLTANPALLP